MSVQHGAATRTSRLGPARVLAALALLGLGGWAALTVAGAALSAWNAVEVGRVHAFQSARDLTFPPSIDLGMAVAVLWYLSFGPVLLAAALGTVHAASVGHGRWRAAAFATLCLAGPAVSVALQRYDTVTGLPWHTIAQYERWRLLKAGLLAAVAAATMVGAWSLVWPRARAARGA